MTRRLLSDLTDTHLRARPEGRNSIVWLLWHVARGEDLGVNVIACEQAEVIDDGDWGKRMGFNDRLAGTGMTSDEVTALAEKLMPRRSSPTGTRSVVGHQHFVIDYGLARDAGQLPDIAADLVRRKVHVLVASGTPSVVPAQNATQTIPVVFVAAVDPVAAGVTASLARPGANVTGLPQCTPISSRSDSTS